MKSLVVSGYGVKVSYRRGVLIVSNGGGSSKYSLADIDRVVLTTSGIAITTKAIRALTEAGIDLIVMDSRGMPTAIIHHPFISRTVDTRRAQYEALGDGRALTIIKVVAISKIMNQAGMLKRVARTYGIRDLSEDIAKIKSLADRVASINGDDVRVVRDEVMRVEAVAARTYWGAYSYLLPKGLGFEGRDQGGGDPVNTVLNYGYGILYSECWKATALAGLDPYAGFLHSDRSGNPVLVFDVVEAFRPAVVDYVVLKAFRSGWRPVIEGGLMSSESRVEVVGMVSNALKSKFRVGTQVKELRSWIVTFTHTIASYLRGSSIIKPLVFRW